MVLDHEKQVAGHFQAKAVKASTPFLPQDHEIKNILDHRTTTCRAKPPRGHPSTERAKNEPLHYDALEIWRLICYCSKTQRILANTPEVAGT